MSIRLGDRVVYRDPNNLGEALMCKVTGITPAAVKPYTVQALNPPYRGKEYNCTEDSVFKSKHLFAKTVIVGPSSGSYFNFAGEFSYSRVENVPKSMYAKADLVLFTGGEDVSPFMYKETQHIRTFCNPERDSQEAVIYREAKRLGIPCVGICRGAQFLNVMNGGRLVQHVSNHTTGHPIRTSCGHIFHVTSTHHQMMDPNDKAEILGWSEKRSDTYEGLTDYVPCTKDNEIIEPEVVIYRQSNDLCVQYHPEMMDAGVAARQYFHEILKELL